MNFDNLVPIAVATIGVATALYNRYRKGQRVRRLQAASLDTPSSAVGPRTVSVRVAAARAARATAAARKALPAGGSAAATPALAVTNPQVPASASPLTAIAPKPILARAAYGGDPGLEFDTAPPPESLGVRALLAEPRTLAGALVVSEILAPPVGLRER